MIGMRLWVKNLVLMVLMIAACAAASALIPTIKIAERELPIDLERIVPDSFGEWHQDVAQPLPILNPVQEEVVSRIYTQTLSRTYIGPDGYRVMLSIAYGNDQRSGIAMAVHYPEVCYPAQGFEVKSNREGTVSTAQGNIPVRRLETRYGSHRHEPVTYWITLGEYVTLGGLNRRLIELRYGMQREIPDGLLFRVSSSDEDSDRAFELQARFIADLLHHLTSEQRVRLAGKGIR